MPMDTTYLSDGFHPLEFETDVDHLDMEGDWPEEIRGTLYRIGPNPRFDPIPPYNPLLGDGMIHAFFIHGRQARYRNRWVRTRQWQLEDEAGRALFATSGDPRLHDPSVRNLPTDGVANTNLVWHGGRLLALEEGHPPIEIDPATLATRRVWDFAGKLPDNMTAHPKLDPDSGEMVFFANYPGRRFDGEIEWYVADRHGTLIARHRLRAPFPGLIHDFAVTRNFVVFVIGPVTISIQRAMARGPALAWEPDKGTHIAVVRRDEPDDVQWLVTAPCFVWHVLNGWNDGGRVTLDLCEQDAPAFPAVDGSMPASERVFCQRLARWTFDWDQPRVERRLLSDVVCEYPRMDERVVMQPTRYGYFACHGGPGTGDLFHRGIARFDFEKHRMSTCFLGATSAVSEPVFVASSGNGAEGHLLCTVYDERTDTSHLVLFDAGAVERGPIATASLNHRVPMGFHGCWLPAPG